MFNFGGIIITAIVIVVDVVSVDVVVVIIVIVVIRRPLNKYLQAKCRAFSLDISPPSIAVTILLAVRCLYTHEQLDCLIFDLMYTARFFT